MAAATHPIFFFTRIRNKINTTTRWIISPSPLSSFCSFWKSNNDTRLTTLSWNLPLIHTPSLSAVFCTMAVEGGGGFYGDARRLNVSSISVAEFCWVPFHFANTTDTRTCSVSTLCRVVSGVELRHSFLLRSAQVPNGIYCSSSNSFPVRQESASAAASVQCQRSRPQSNGKYNNSNSTFFSFFKNN